LQELAQVLFRPRLVNKYGLRPSELQSFIKLVARQGIWIEPTFTVSICKDKDDNKFLALAAAGQADYIVSADDDLLVLKECQDAKIITPQQFFEKIIIA
jgi:putative PIN family toxin of toxin-antitoxin system